MYSIHSLLLLSAYWTDVLLVLDLGEVVICDAITICVDPVLTVVAANEVLRAIVVVGLVAEWAEVALSVERVAIFTESATRDRRLLGAPLPGRPESSAVVRNWWQLRLATQAVNAVLAVPAARR